MLKEGDVVLVFDTRLYFDDWSTPLSVTLQPATVLRRYQRKCPYSGQMDDLVDVRFHYDGYESKAHFAMPIEQRNFGGAKPA